MFFHRKTAPKSGEAPAGGIEYLIVGLGNPGREYENTRHNAGFLALDAIARDCGCAVKRLKFKAVVGEGLLGGHRCLLMKPDTFMNNSGEAVQAAAQFYKLPPERIIVLFDDISLSPGRLRVRRKGSDGGHNGIKSILSRLGSDAFPRVKLGVGAKPHPDYDLAAWVLSVLSKEDSAKLREAAEQCPDILRLILNGQIDEAMSRYNS